MSAKTNRSLKKRIKKTSSGKVLHRRPGYRHLLSNKSSQRKRDSRQWQELHKGQVKALERQYGDL
jgi:large subunit ribosomal protein L35